MKYKFLATFAVIWLVWSLGLGLLSLAIDPTGTIYVSGVLAFPVIGSAVLMIEPKATKTQMEKIGIKVRKTQIILTVAALVILFVAVTNTSIYISDGHNDNCIAPPHGWCDVFDRKRSVLQVEFLPFDAGIALNRDPWDSDYRWSAEIFVFTDIP